MTFSVWFTNGDERNGDFPSLEEALDHAEDHVRPLELAEVLRGDEPVKLVRGLEGGGAQALDLPQSWPKRLPPRGLSALVLVVPLALAVILGALAAGCATAYGPAGFMGGYSERQINPTTWAVTFQGNPSTRARQTREGALRRAAELTLQAGGVGFVVREDAIEVKTTTTREDVRCRPEGEHITCRGGDEVVTERPATTLVITVLGADQVAAATGAGALVYDARMLAGR